jgi:hypothetical protein
MADNELGSLQRENSTGICKYFCMPHDDGRMTETCCGNDIGGAEAELLR